MLGVRLLLLNASSPPEIEEAFANIVAQRAGAFLLGTDPFFISARDQLVTLANRYRRSLAFVAAARLAFLAIKEPETERRLLLPIKNNLGALAPGLSYSLVQHIVSKGIVLGGGGGVEYLPVPRQGEPAGREA